MIIIHKVKSLIYLIFFLALISASSATLCDSGKEFRVYIVHTFSMHLYKYVCMYLYLYNTYCMHV